MPLLEFPLVCLQQRLDNGLWLAEALLFPEVSCLAGEPEEALKQLVREVRAVLKETPTGQISRRRISGPVLRARTRVRLSPPKSNPAWREPICLEFPYVFWQHGDAPAVVAVVPELDLEVLCASRAELRATVRREVRKALVRARAQHSLQALAACQRRPECQLRRLRLKVRAATPKESAQRAAQREERQKSVLKQVAQRLPSSGPPAAFECDALLERIAGLTGGPDAVSLLLVGPSGVGKTAAVRELARRGAAGGRPQDASPRGIWSTSGSRLVAGMSGFGMWQQRCEQLVREAERTRALVHLENLVELIEVGKCEDSTQGIASFLRPFIQQRRLQVIAECTPEQLPVIERQDPQLLEVLQQVAVEEPAPEVCRVILRKQSAALGAAARLGAESLETLDRLHRRYATYSANPGRSLRFLTSLVRDLKGAVGSAAVVREFSRETGLPQFLLDPDARLDLAATRQRLRSRVLGQGPAVDLVVDVLSAVKAGLARPGRPIASLMFIGPTGVGKTELAKALCEFMYRDPGRMVRLDMSEYANGPSVDRLIGAFASRGELTDRIREQPFTVVLLDEFEKAHPRFQDLLLQLLGEGRLTDGSGRLADFRNAIVILTSNLGAESFGRGAIGFGGEGLSATAAADHFQRKVREAVRPELFNRIDRIVPFAPLPADVIQAIAVRELEKVRRREGVLFRGVKLEVAPAAVEHLARQGYQPRYGARPLKRAIERLLVQPLAAELNRYQGDTALEATADWEDGRIRLQVRARRDAAGRALSRMSQDATLLSQCERATAIRRRVQRLDLSPAARKLENDLFQLERLQQKMLEQPQRVRPGEANELRKLAQLQTLAAEIAALSQQAADCESQLRMQLYRAASPPAGEAGEAGAAGEAGEAGEAGAAGEAGEAGEAGLPDLEAQLAKTLLQLFLQRGGRHDRLCLCGFSLDPEPLQRLFSIYLAWARRHDCPARLSVLRRHRPEELQIRRTRLKFRGANGAGAETDGAESGRGESGRGESERGESERGETAGGETDVNRPAAWAVDVIETPPNRADQTLASLSEDALGVALELEGLGVYERLGTERGRHLFLQGPAKLACLVEASGGPLSSYEPPQGIDRAAFFGRPLQEFDLRRTYDLNRERLDDPWLKSVTRLPERELAPLVLDNLEAFFQSRLDELIDA